MLVLSRKLGEKIYIGQGPDQVTITVVGITRGKVRLGIETRQHTPILLAPGDPRREERRAG